MTNLIQLKIIITNTFTIQCFIIDQQGNQTPINLKENNKEESNHFIKEWFYYPELFTLYKIQIQNKEYSVIAEVLFAFIINEFKQIIEKKWIINSVTIELPKDNKLLLERIKISLEAIGMKGIEFN